MTLKVRQKLISFIAVVMTVLVAAASAAVPVTVFAAAPAAPEFSVKGGIYDSAVFVGLSGEGEIYYTTDGSVPTKKSNKYTSPIYITSSSGNLPKATTIRAAAFYGNESSAVSSGTYLIGKNMSSALGGVPIVNLVVEPYDLWDSQNGIYTNYNYEHKVPAVFHYITPEGETDINRNVEIKISGHGSRSAAKKSFRVYFKKTDPEQGKYLEYNLVPPAGVSYYANINFRISDWQKTNIKDTLAQRIGKQTRVDIAECTPMALFLNGEYWGLYECREHYNDEYFASHYGLDKDTIVYLDRDWQRSLDETVIDGVTYYDKIEYSEGPEDGNKDGVLGETYYRDQWAYIKSLAVTKDITKAEVYEEFCAKVDIDNFIDYLITYIYCANDDWPGNNFKLWRVTEEAVDASEPLADGKWRFMIHDFDIAFDDINHNTLYLSTRQKDANTEARHPKYATDLLDNLLRNDEFRSEFAQRTAVYLSTIMGKDVIDGIINGLVDERRAAKSLDIARWKNNGLRDWNDEINWLHRFANERPAKLREQYRNNLNRYYGAGITGEAKLGVSSAVDYSINGALMTEGESGELTVFAGIPLTVKAENADITVSCGDGRFVAAGSLTFIPNTDSYEINIEPSDGQDHSLVLYYSFENDDSRPTGIIDDSLGGNNGRVLNNEGYPRLITVENAPGGKVLNFPGGEYGEGAAVKIPEAVRKSILGDYTVSMWVKADGSYMWGDKPQRFFDFGVGDYDSIFVRYNVKDGELRFQDRKLGSSADDPKSLISVKDKSFIDKWGLLTVTYTAADNTAVVYVNGESVMSGDTFTRSLSDMAPLTNEKYGMYLGRTMWQNTDNPDFKGLMDEVRIYNRAISEEEIQELYLTTNPESAATTKPLTLLYMAEGVEIGRETVEVPRSGAFTYSEAPAIVYSGKLYTAATIEIANTAALGSEYAVDMADTPFLTDDLCVNAYVGDNAELPLAAKLYYDGGVAEIPLSYDSPFSSGEAGVYTVSGEHGGITVDVTVKVYERWQDSLGGTVGRASKVTVRFTDSSGDEIAEPYEVLVPTETSYTVTDKLLDEYPHIANVIIPEPVIVTEPTHEIYVTGEKLVGVFGVLSGDLSEGALNVHAGVINTGEAETEALLIIARYEGNSLAEVKTEKIELPANSVKILALSLSMPYDREAGEDVRAYLWTCDLRPLDVAISAYELSVTKK